MITSAAAVPAAGEAGLTPRDARINYWVFILEGGVYMGGTAFLNANTLLPTIVHNLGGPDWLVALTPSLALLGFILPPLFTAHRVDRMSRFFPFVLVASLFQRLPYLVGALALFFLAPRWPALALIGVALTPFVSGFFGGISLTAWQQLVVKCVPERRRSHAMAARYTIASLIAIGAGLMVTWILARWPGYTGYGVLSLLTFVSVMISYAIFACTREPHTPRPPHPPLSLAEVFRRLPHLTLNNASFARYLLTRLFRFGMFIPAPFLAIYAQRVTGQPETFLGQLVIAQAVGAILGNLLGGYLGDHHSSKASIITGVALFAALAAWSPFAASAWAFQAIFLLFGFAQNCSEVGMQVLSLEIVPLQHRSVYLAIISLVGLPGMLGASFLARALRSPGGSFAPTAIATILCMGLTLLCSLRLRDPREATPPMLPQEAPPTAEVPP